MPSASKRTLQSLGRFFTNFGKNFCMYSSRPNPGPITHEWMAFYQDFNLLAQCSSMIFYSYSEHLSSYREMKTGWVMIQGEYDLMAGELNLEQKIWERSPPTFKAEIAEQQGAPVNQKEPPTTATLPLRPLRQCLLRVGKTDISLRRRRVFLIFNIMGLVLVYKIVVIITILLRKMDEGVDYRAVCIKLRGENQILKEELKEDRERIQHLKREIQILSQVEEDKPQAASGQFLQSQVDRLRQELVACLNEKEQMEIVNKAYLDKIDDLKYHNGQLKMLNDRITKLHEREIDMVKKQACNGREVRQLEERGREAVREREKVEKQLQEVAKVAGEMERYYMEEIRSKGQVIKEQQKEIQRLTGEIEGAHTERVKQSQLIAQYQYEINDLKSKIKFLIGKIQQQQQQYQQDTISKPSLGAMSAISADLIQSKMMQSNSSVDSFRVTPTSLPMKQNLTRRNTSGAKTPSKYGVTYRNQRGQLQERNY